MKPKLNQEQKACLIQEVVEWAIGNSEITGPTSSRLQVFDVLRSIQSDSDTRASANNLNVFIRELKKNGILWGKVIPFLRNNKGGCCTKVTDPQAYGRCNHSADEHINGKCSGVHKSYYVNGHYSSEPITFPCSCPHYKSTQTW